MMLESPEVVHKSHLTNLDTFLFGLMTQRAVGTHGCTLSGIEDNLLRMILERSMKYVQNKDMSEYVEKEGLVEFLHKTVGKSVESSLRYWAFMVEIMRSVILNGHYSMNEFVSRVKIIRDNVYNLKGITSFCLTISSSVERYLDDENVAEFILNVGYADKKFTVLLTNMLFSKTGAPKLIEIINSNIARTKKLHEKLIIQPSQSHSEGKSESSDTSTKQDSVDIWKEFLNAVSGEPHLFSTRASLTFKEWLVKLANDDTEINIKYLDDLIQNGNKCGILGKRRATALVVRASSVGSEIETHFDKSGNTRQLRAEMPKARTIRNLLKDITRDITKLKEIEKTPTDYDSAPIEFIKFDLVREMIQQMKIETIKKFGDLIQECPICFEEIKDPKNKKALHGEARHFVCASCSTALRLCPFCRCDL
jgi:hypothetical protein